MDSCAARPGLLKQANLSLIRRVIKAKGTATRAEIAAETRISSTTVRSLLSEMLLENEIASVGYDQSSGGRKAERYRFNPERYYGAAFCVTNKQLHCLLVDICGGILQVEESAVRGDDIFSSITPVLDRWLETKEIKAVGLGVPGIVDGDSYWTNDYHDENLYRVDIGSKLSERYGIPVVLENDLNATAIGFGRCYLNEFPTETPENTNMAYLHFEKGCISAGFIAGGRIIRGAKNFAGELGLIPVGEGKCLDDYIASPTSDSEYAKLVTGIISFICGVLNPQYVALGGPNFRKQCIGSIGDGLSALLPGAMFTEILYAPDVWHDYHDGMAFLTAGRIFDDVKLVNI